MASGTARTGVNGSGGDSPVQDPVSWNSRGSGVTLNSAGHEASSGRSRLPCPGAMGCSSKGYVHTGQSFKFSFRMKIYVVGDFMTFSYMYMTWLRPTLHMLRLVT